MYKIIVSTNDNTHKNLSCVVSKAQFNRIQKIENLGGFNRFYLDLITDKEPKQKSQFLQALSFLSESVFYCSVAELQKII